METFRHHFDNWRDILVIVFLVITFGLTWHQNREIKGLVHTNRTLTMKQCRRTQEFSPPIARYYAEHKVLAPSQLKDYISTIPKHCN